MKINVKFWIYNFVYFFSFKTIQPFNYSSHYICNKMPNCIKKKYNGNKKVVNNIIERFTNSSQKRCQVVKGSGRWFSFSSHKLILTRITYPVKVRPYYRFSFKGLTFLEQVGSGLLQSLKQLGRSYSKYHQLGQ